MTDAEGGPAGTGADGSPAGTGADGNGIRWGLGDAVLGFVLGYVLVALLVTAWLASSDADAESFSTFLVGQTGLYLGIGGVPLWASRRKGAGTPAADYGLGFRAGDARKGIPIGVVAQLAAIAVYALLQPLLDDVDVDEAVRELADSARGPLFVVLAVVLVVVAPVVEEVFFRGLLMRALDRRWNARVALHVSSFVFAVAHVGTQPLQLPALFVVGVLFGRLAQRHGRLGPSIWAHAAFNGLAVILLGLDP